MALTKEKCIMTMNVLVQDMDEFKDLINELSVHYGELPKSVQEKLMALANVCETENDGGAE